MTKSESAKMRRLEAENERLRERLDKCMQIYRDQTYELVDYRVKLDLIEEALARNPNG